MANVEKVSVALSSELLDTVKDAVSSGEYASASEVIREALREWRLRKPLRHAEIERLRHAWNEGVSSGPLKQLDMEDLKGKARQRFKNSPRTHG
jgi:antitoxin ParD1/3/4